MSTTLQQHPTLTIDDFIKEGELELARLSESVRAIRADELQREFVRLFVVETGETPLEKMLKMHAPKLSRTF